ncbi:Uncharacterised protein [Fusicatenibacter saccharivorans]|uniref:Uncharacterized protein n=1 Tax=Fusicatenibacter saccharivorans TaxID=1150298 RepID=A0A174QVW2_9FIRM|nr:Uncharacterised protein [Fusicatenibacter saccharivorans]
MVWKVTIVLWVLFFVVRWLVTVTLSQEDKLRMAFGIGVKKSPMKILMVLLLLAAVAMTVVTVIWFLFVRL